MSISMSRLDFFRTGVVAGVSRRRFMRRLAVHLYRRRQRHQCRGRLRWHVQRNDLLQRRYREGRGPHSI